MFSNNRRDMWRSNHTSNQTSNHSLVRRENSEELEGRMAIVIMGKSRSGRVLPVVDGC